MGHAAPGHIQRRRAVESISCARSGLGRDQQLPVHITPKRFRQAPEMPGDGAERIESERRQSESRGCRHTQRALTEARKFVRDPVAAKAHR